MNWNSAADQLKAEQRQERSLLYGQKLSPRQIIFLRVNSAFRLYGPRRLLLGTALVAIGAVLSKFL